VARRRRWFAEVIAAEFRIPASKFNHEMKTREAPTSRPQAPEKPQASKLKSPVHFLEFGSWNFSGAWMLGFGAFALGFP
jgi:hypothetical protein